MNGPIPAIARRDASPSTQDTTAEIIRRLRATGQPRDLTALGVALHHFTELVRDHLGLDAGELHAATAVLTKQVESLLVLTDPWPAIRRLVTDPERTATPDGETAIRMCGSAWALVRREADRRAADAVEGAVRYGADAIARLASLHGNTATYPWWGTASFDRLIDEWLGDARLTPVLAASLRQAPEQAPPDVLHDILRR